MHSSSFPRIVPIATGRGPNTHSLSAGYSLGPLIPSKKDHREVVVTLRWSTPKSTPMDLQFCTSAYRVTPSNVSVTTPLCILSKCTSLLALAEVLMCAFVAQVTSRPTICLINFVLSGKSVLLEQSRKGPAKVVSHILSNHGGKGVWLVQWRVQPGLSGR